MNLKAKLIMEYRTIKEWRRPYVRSGRNSVPSKKKQSKPAEVPKTPKERAAELETILGIDKNLSFSEKEKHSRSKYLEWNSRTVSRGSKKGKQEALGWAQLFMEYRNLKGFHS